MPKTISRKTRNQQRSHIRGRKRQWQRLLNGLPSRPQPKTPLNGQMLVAAIAWALPETIFKVLPKFHGNTKWTVTALITLAFFWVWSTDPALTSAFTIARDKCHFLFGSTIATSYQGFLKALEHWTPHLVAIIIPHLQSLMMQYGGEYARVAGWVPLAVDGSRIGVPRTKKNEAKYCSEKKSNSKKTAKNDQKQSEGQGNQDQASQSEEEQHDKPMIWVTLLYHMKLRMPWNFAMGPKGSSERIHFLDMLKSKFEPMTLFCGDAGFVGYEFWKEIVESGHSFLVRVGSNVSLLETDFNGRVNKREGLVYCWPKGKAKEGEPPLVLRLVQITLGKRKMYLVTNVLDEKKLSLEMCREFYRLRWGVEVQFRSIKQTYERRELKSRTPEHAELELTWSLIGLWVVQVMAMKTQLERDKLPEQYSVAGSLRVVRHMLEMWALCPEPKDDLENRMESAVVTRYASKGKTARYRPPKRKKDRPAAGSPIVVDEKQMKADQSYQKAIEKISILMDGDEEFRRKMAILIQVDEEDLRRPNNGVALPKVA